MKNLIKLIITIAIFAVLYHYIDIEKTWELFLASDKIYIFIAVLMQFLSTYFAAYRWRLIMKLLVFKEKFSYYIQSYFKGALFNQVLPGSIDGDAVRIIDLVQKGYSKKDSIYGIFVDRIIGLVGLLILNLLANMLFYGTFPKWLFQLINLVTLSGIAGFLVLLNLQHISFLSKIKGINLIYKLSSALSELYSSKKVLIKHLTISMLVHLFSVLTIYALGEAFYLDLPFQVYLIAVPPIFLLTIVPISLAGWGVRESAMVGIFILVGASKEAVLSISVMYGLILIITALPGAYFYLNAKKIDTKILDEIEETNEEIIKLNEGKTL